MHWFFYIIGFIELLSNDAASSQLGIFLIVCGLFVQFRKKKVTAPVRSKNTGDSDGFGGRVHGALYDSDGNWVNPIDITVDNRGYGHSSNGDTWMRDSEDDNWEPYHA